MGPKADGTIPEPSIERLKEVGRWMKANGQAIYGTAASPTRRPGWGRITTKAGDAETTLYLHVFNWPKDGKLPVSVSNEALSCRLLTAPDRRFEVDRTDNGLVVNVTGEAPDPICSVVTLQVAGQPQVIVYRVPQQADGQVVLQAVDAELHGELRVETKQGKSNIGYWTNSGNWIEWGIRIGQPSEFEVVADIATQGKGRLTIQVADCQLEAPVPNTGNYGTFQTVTLGRIRIDERGDCTLTVRPDKQAWSPVNIRSITLKPTR